MLEKLGSEALVETNCAICKSSRRKHLFEKQGFHYHRCVGCEHVYVSPRIKAFRLVPYGPRAGPERLSYRTAGGAKVLCSAHLPSPAGARSWTSIDRFGFGKGYYCSSRKSYGFEVYGTDTSPSQVESLRPLFGDRLHLVTMEDTALPWTGFDAVVISHVLEHLERPDELLGDVFRAMNPDGVLYVAVPDLESVQFQLFGKKWEAISPLAHFQYFHQSSLTHLLTDSLFTDIETGRTSASARGNRPALDAVAAQIGSDRCR